MEEGTWYQCHTCYILLNKLTQFTLHVENHKVQHKSPIPLFHTKTGVRTLLTLPEKDERVIFIPKIRLVSIESSQKDCARLDIVLPFIILSRVDGSVQSETKDDSNLNVNKGSLGPHQIKLKVQKRNRGQCLYCHDNLKSMTMKAHLSKCRNPPEFFCLQCSSRQVSAATLAAHIALFHSNQKKYKCIACSKLFATLHAVKKHSRDTPCKKKIEKMKRITTELPSQVVSSKDTPLLCPKTPVSRHTTQCPNCGRRIPDFRKDEHFEKCTIRTRVFPCLYSCSANFKTPQDLADHIRIFHQSEPQYKCEFCDKRFSVLYALQRHVARTCLPKQSNGTGKSVELGTSLSCPYCKKEFLSRKQRNEHLRRTRCLLNQPQILAKVSANCKICKKSFLTTRHLRNHLKGKACGSSNTSSPAANTVKETTIPENVDLCICQGCGKNFLKMKNLRRHLRRKICLPVLSNMSPSYPEIRMSMRNKRHHNHMSRYLDQEGKASRTEATHTKVKVEHEVEVEVKTERMVNELDVKPIFLTAETNSFDFKPIVLTKEKEFFPLNE